MQGDWTCPSCRANVFASKTNCFSCGAPRPAEASGGGYRGGAMGGAMGMGAMGGAMAARWAAGGANGGAMGAMGGANGAMAAGAAPWARWAAPWAPWAPWAASGGAMGDGRRARVVPAAPSGGATTSLEVPCQGNEGRVIGKGGDMMGTSRTPPDANST